MARAVDVAIAEHPTLGGYRLIHVTLDDSLGGNWDLDRALQNMRRAVHEPAIAGVVGPFLSLQARFLIPLSSDSRLVVMSPSNTEDCLTEPPQCLSSAPAAGAPTNYFRVAARNTLLARAAADLAVHKLGISRFAVLTDPYAPRWGRQMSDAFSDEVARAGGQVVFNQLFFTLDSNFAPLLRAARAAGAQSLFISAADDRACTIRPQMQAIFPDDAYVFSGDSLSDEGCIQNANLGGKTDDHFVVVLATREPTPVPADLKGIVRSHGTPQYMFAAYDCARILIDAIDRAIRANGGKIPTREQVREAVAATSNFKGITGTYSFAPNGDVAEPSLSFYTVKQGYWEFWRNP